MSRRAPHATVEEIESDEDIFDDDTDIPLPSRPLPGGAPGPLLQSLNEDDDYGFGGGFRRGAASEINLGPGGASPSLLNQQHQVPSVSDLTPYKKWTCIYPISIDAKRAYHAGERRIAFLDAVWWPLSKDIADASARLGLGTLHEVSKCHPRDWANPGRVRVQWKKDNGGFVNPEIRTKKQLLAAIASYIQAVKPELVPKTEQMSKQESKAKASTSKSGPEPSASSSKATASSKAKGKAAGKAPQTQPDLESSSDTLAVIGAFTHAPPTPSPALAVRVSAYSPAIPSGMLVDALKAAMNAPGPEGGAVGGAGMGAGKGKRKVIRVRG